MISPTGLYANAPTSIVADSGDAVAARSAPPIMKQRQMRHNDIRPLQMSYQTKWT